MKTYAFTVAVHFGADSPKAAQRFAYRIVALLQDMDLGERGVVVDVIPVDDTPEELE